MVVASSSVQIQVKCEDPPSVRLARVIDAPSGSEQKAVSVLLIGWLVVRRYLGEKVEAAIKSSL